MMESKFFELLEPRQLLSTTIAVNTGTTYQTIRGMGGSIAKNARWGGSPVSDTNSNYALAHLGMSSVRVALNLAAWEPNDNGSNPDKINWSGFKDTGSTTAEFKQLQTFQKDGMTIVASIFDGPNWLTTTPEKKQHRSVNKSKFADMALGVATWLLQAKNKYGVTINHVSINESNAGYNLSFSSTVFEPFVAIAGPMFKKLGLGSVKWDIGDDGFVTTDSFVKPVLQDKAIAQYLGPIDWHSWNLDNDPDSAFAGLVAIAKQYGKEIWCTELGYDPLLNDNHPEAFTTFSNALKDAEMYSRTLSVIHATVVDYWDFANDFPLVSSSSSPYPDYYAVKSYQDNLKPGAQIVSAKSSDSSVLSVAAKDTKHNHFFEQAINEHGSSTTVTFTGLPNQKLTLTRIASGMNAKVIGTYTPSGGKLTLTLPGNSINTLAGNFSSSSSAAKTAVAMSASGTKSMFAEAPVGPDANTDTSLTKDLLV